MKCLEKAILAQQLFSDAQCTAEPNLLTLGCDYHHGNKNLRTAAGVCEM